MYYYVVYPGYFKVNYNILTHLLIVIVSAQVPLLCEAFPDPGVSFLTPRKPLSLQSRVLSYLTCLSSFVTVSFLAMGLLSWILRTVLGSEQTVSRCRFAECFDE